MQEMEVQSLVGEDPLEKEMATHPNNLAWRRKWLPTPIFLPGESHWQRSLAGYSPWGRRVGHNWSDLECISNQAYILLVTKKTSKQIFQVNDYSAFPCIRSYKKQGSLKKVKVVQSCPTVCNPMDYTSHGILQAKILEWAAVPFSRGSS